MNPTTPDGAFAPPTEYDYRMYDKIWQRVSPELDPYPDIRAGSHAAAPAQSPAPAPAASQPSQDAAATEEVPSGGGDLGQLPGAELNPCCLGSEAAQSLGVLEGFLQEELAQRQCLLSLARCVRDPRAARLLRSLAGEKEAAARQLRAARYLATGDCSSAAILVEPACWKNLPQALRAVYHQEACNGFNYQRAADEALDPCLQRLFNDLGQAAYRRADAVMTLVGRLLP